MIFKGWLKFKLNECATFQEGYVNPSQSVQSYFGDEVKWLRANDLNNARVFETSRKLSQKGFLSAGKSAKLFKPGTLAISKSGTIGRLGILEDFMCGNRAVINIEVDTKLCDNLYIFYYLLHNQKAIEDMATGSVQRNLYISILGDIDIELPPLYIQKRVASILSSLDDKIELNRQTNRTLEAIAQALFKEWFVDFNYPGATGEMQESELGEIPKGWKVESLDNIADFLNGLALQKFPPQNESDILPVIKIRELKAGITNNSDKASKSIHEKYIIDDGDLLFSWSGTLEVKFWVGGKGALNQHLFKVTSSRYPIWFCYFWLLQHLPEFRRIAEDKATTMGHIQRKHLTDALCVVPNNIETMDNFFTPIIEQYINNEEQIQTLTRLRDTLLPKLMKGELTITETKQLTAAVI